MAKEELRVRIQQKHDTQAHWDLATNFIPMAGEIIVYDVDPNVPTYTYPRFKVGDGVTLLTNLPFVGSPFSGTRKYVEEFKTDSNTWDQAFELLIKYCEENTYINSADNSRGHGYVACTNNFHYTLQKPLKIGDIDVDFENCNLYNNTIFSEDNQACVILTGAQNRVQKFGTVTGRRSVGILIDSSKGLYKYNKLYAKKIQGEKHALNISSTNYACYFNEYHVPLLKAMENPLRLYCESSSEHWVNESYLYLGSIEGYRSTIPTLLISMTNISRCNVYNVDLECGPSNDKNHTVEVELTNCNDVAFYNPRTKEPHNAVQFRFIGESFDNYIDAEYCKYGTIDSSQMKDTCNHYNIWRGRVVSNNAGYTTNMNTLRIYKDMIIPEVLNPMTKKVTQTYIIGGSQLESGFFPDNSELMVGGIPTLINWHGGDIIINKKFIALLPSTIKIAKILNGVGNIVDENGKIIKLGSELEQNKIYNIDIKNIIYADGEPNEETGKIYQYIDDVELLINKVGSIKNQEEEIVHNLVPGFIRNTGSTGTLTTQNYIYTDKVEYIGGSINFRAICTNDETYSYSIVSFFDCNKQFLGNIESRFDTHKAFFDHYNTYEYANLIGKDYSYADVISGTITEEEIKTWYPNTAYIAVSCPIYEDTPSSIINIIYKAIENSCFAQQVYDLKKNKTIMLISPNGTKFNISIDDNGILTSTEIVEL